MRCVVRRPYLISAAMDGPGTSHFAVGAAARRLLGLRRKRGIRPPLVPQPVLGRAFLNLIRRPEKTAKPGIPETRVGINEREMLRLLNHQRNFLALILITLHDTKGELHA